LNMQMGNGNVCSFKVYSNGKRQTASKIRKNMSICFQLDVSRCCNNPPNGKQNTQAICMSIFI